VAAGPDKSIGEWNLLISGWGRFWACPVLTAGIPEQTAIFDATTGLLVTDETLLANIKATDFSGKSLAFLTSYIPQPEAPGLVDRTAQDSAVVLVEHGDKWFDYRPARPEHFVGRKKAQQELMQLFTKIKKRRTDTRVFAIKGDSGIGKSSLVAKMRDASNRSQKPNRLFFYAVDVRAANDASYIYSSLLAALLDASRAGFGTPMDLRITNYLAPLDSESVRQFLRECERKRELIILVFDQFEELYSKPELLSVFDTAKSLMFSALASSTSLVLGFAWKTDSSIPQEHPAYHMWHELSDHRYEVSLRPFSHADATNSLDIFEKELGERIRPELRKYILENSQGYPWLLKKLCIHMYEQLQAGLNQHQLADLALDVASLFDRDLSNLTDAQTACLRFVAQNAPVDWYEVLQATGHEVVQSLQDKRLLIRRGDKLNLYWDIFRDYVLTRTIPAIPFTLIPSSPSIDAIMRIALELDEAEGKCVSELAAKSKLSANTVRNILHDLEQFGVIRSEGASYCLDPHLRDISPRTVLTRIRLKFKRHALTELLRKHNVSKAASIEQIIQYLRTLNPTAQYHSRTWNTYAKKMALWLEILGLARKSPTGYMYEDSGDVKSDSVKRARGGRRQPVFLGDASPAKTIEALELLKIQPQSQEFMLSQGFRNACAVLCRFGLVELTDGQGYRVLDVTYQFGSSVESVWVKAKEEPALEIVSAKLLESPMSSPLETGRLVAEHFSRDWKETSWQRIGNSLRQWSSWIMMPPNSDGSISIPPGRLTSEDRVGYECGDLFAYTEGR
jgi:DNA-binding Lrp family transcriptional regulator